MKTARRTPARRTDAETQLDTRLPLDFGDVIRSDYDLIDAAESSAYEAARRIIRGF